MKKFLSLVLALAMTMSLVTISAGAEDFTDADDITYAEAVEVMTAIGVVGGYADGSFNPTAGLTRGAAAKIICNMLLGPTTAEALSCNNAPFVDVPVDNTFAGYIAYCSNEGIISGYADGTFKPAAPLTGYAFMKMLLGALGYDATVENYTGSNWSVQVAKRALNLELNDGLVGSFVGSKALNREEACLYAFNTLKATMVEYDSNTSVSVGDITISTSTKADEVRNSTKTDGNIEDDGKMQFAEKYFTKLTAKDARDDFGRPATAWKYDKDDIGTYAETADYVFLLDDNYEDEYTTVGALLQELSDEDIEGNVATTFYVNGDKTTEEADVLGAANYGTTVEVFVNDDDYATDVVAYYYSLAQIEGVDDDVKTADAKKDVTCYVDFDVVGELKDTEVAGFNAKTYVEDAYVAYIYSNDQKEIIASNVVDEVEGSVSTVKGNDYATIDGSKYYVVTESGANVQDLKTGSDNTYILFLDVNGNVIGTKVVDESANLDEVYYVTSTWTEVVNKYGKNEDHFYAQLVALDGTILEVETEISYADCGLKLVTISDKKWTKGDTTYKANNDKYDLKAWSNDDYKATKFGSFSGWTFTKSMTRFVMTDGTLYRFNGNTQYVLVEGTESDLDVTVKTGGIGLTGNGNMKGYIITEDDSNVALYVVIYDTTEIDENADFDADNLVFIEKNSSEKGDGYRVQTVYLADGSKESWKVDESEYGTLAGFYEYDVNEDGYYELNKASDLKVTNGVWDDEEGVVENAKYVKGCLFEDLLTIGDIADIDVSNAAFVDIHDTDDGYSKTVKTLTALDNLFEKDGYTTSAQLSVSVSEDGAVLVVVTSLSHVKDAK